MKPTDDSGLVSTPSQVLLAASPCPEHSLVDSHQSDPLPVERRPCARSSTQSPTLAAVPGPKVLPPLRDATCARFPARGAGRWQLRPRLAPAQSKHAIGVTLHQSAQL